MLFRKIKLFSQNKKLKEAQKEATARLVEERLAGLKEHYTVHQIEIERICPPEDGRQITFQGELKELCDSIRRYGLLTPLSVRRICPDHSSLGGIFALVDGNRRFEAVKALGMRTVPCIICQLNAPDLLPAMSSSLLQTKELTPFEKAELMERLRTDRCINDSQVAALLSLDSETVSAYRSLLSLQEDERVLALSAQLPFYLLCRLAAIKSESERRRWLVETVHTLRTVFPDDRYGTPPQQGESSRRMLFSDVRPFFNSIEQMIRRMRDAGITASGERREDDECYEFVLRVQKESKIRMVGDSGQLSKGA